jgi:chromosome segregation ATPase
MGAHPGERDHLEQDIAAIRTQLQQFFVVLEDLTEIQQRFEGMAQTYQELKYYLDAVKLSLDEVKQIQKDYNQFLAGGDQQFESMMQRFKQTSAAFEAQFHDLEPFQERIEHISFQQDQLEANVRQNESFTRNLSREVHTMSRIGVISIIGFTLALLVTWVLFAT